MSKRSGKIAILAVTTFILLIAVWMNVKSAGYLTLLDQRAVGYFIDLREPSLVKLFSMVTLFGGWQITFATVFIVSVTLSAKKQGIYVLPLIASFVSGEVLSILGKLILQRARPESGVYELGSFAFPSGHSTMAVALYGFLTYILIEQFNSLRIKISIALIGTLFIFAIGLSRIYLGVHFISDVLGGFLLGAICLMLGIAFLDRLRSKDKLNNKKTA